MPRGDWIQNSGNEGMYLLCYHNGVMWLFKVYQVTSGTYHFFDRHYGRSLGSEEAVFREGMLHDVM